MSRVDCQAAIAATPLREPPSRVITVRMTESMHRAITHLSHATERSINRLCVEALQAHLEQHAEPLRAFRLMHGRDPETGIVPPPPI